MHPVAPSALEVQVDQYRHAPDEGAHVELPSQT